MAETTATGGGTGTHNESTADGGSMGGTTSVDSGVAGTRSNTATLTGSGGTVLESTSGMLTTGSNTGGVGGAGGTGSVNTETSTTATSTTSTQEEPGAGGSDAGGAGGSSSSGGGTSSTGGSGVSSTGGTSSTGASGAGGTGGCSGCLVEDTCLGAGQVHPSVPCQVCSPASNTLVPNVAAACGAGPSTCSNQDTCDSEGVCQPNHTAAGVGCTGGQCDGAGTCEPFVNPFSCEDADPPPTVLALDLLSAPSGTTPPSASGGTIRDGRYAPIMIEVYGTDVAPAYFITELTFEFSNGFVQVGYEVFVGSGAVHGSAEIHFVGSATTVGTALQFDAENCATEDCSTLTGVLCELPSSLPYTISGDTLVTIMAASDGSTVVTTYERE